MPDDRVMLNMAMFAAQCVFGALALFGLIAASVLWANTMALLFGVNACALVVVSQVFGMRAQFTIAFGLWVTAFISGAIALILLL